MADNILVDKNLAEAIRIALRDFGENILSEERLIGVLKDFQGFRNFQQGEFIVRTLISDGVLQRLYSLNIKAGKARPDLIHRETERIARQYGFSYSLIKTVLYSFLNGVRINVESIATEKQAETKVAKSNISLTKTTNNNTKPKGTAGSHPSKPITNRNSNNNTTQHGLNNSNTGNTQNSSSDAAFRHFILVGGVLLLYIIAPILWIKGCDRKEDIYHEEFPVNVVVDSIIYEEYDSIQTFGLEKNSSEAISESDLKQETKKKPIDPRFQYPDGRYKQPHEYMEYFNEDYDDEDEYEEGYEDGYDDAQDEF